MSLSAAKDESKVEGELIESKEEHQNLSSAVAEQKTRDGSEQNHKSTRSFLAAVELVNLEAGERPAMSVDSSQNLVWQLPCSSMLVGNSALCVSEQKFSSDKKKKKQKQKNQKKNSTEFGTQYIAPEIMFTEAGIIRAWHIHAKTGSGASAQMEMQVWRPVGFDKCVSGLHFYCCLVLSN